MAQLLLGGPVAEAMAEKMVPRVRALSARGIVPTLAIVRMGARPDDLSYERAAIARAGKLGIVVRPYVLDERAPQETVSGMVHSINTDRTVDGCLVFRPLPPAIDEDALCESLAPAKDVDGVTSTSLVSVFTGEGTGFAPSTAEACLSMFDHYGIALEGRHVVVVGRSLVVGKPLSMMLLARNATVTVCHSRTRGLAELCRAADIVVCATGNPRAFGAEYFSAGQVVIDVGMNMDADGRLCGDVAFEEVEPVVAAITPVPRGIGAVTTAVTMEHVVTATEQAAAARAAHGV